MTHLEYLRSACKRPPHHNIAFLDRYRPELAAVLVDRTSTVVSTKYASAAALGMSASALADKCRASFNVLFTDDLAQSICEGAAMVGKSPETFVRQAMESIMEVRP